MSIINYSQLPYIEDFKSGIKANNRWPVLGNLKGRFPATQWTWEKLVSIVAEKPVTPLIDIPRSGQFASDYRKHEVAMPFSEFVSLAKSEPEKPCYLAYLRPRDLDMQLGEDADFDFLDLDTRFGTDTRIWLGSKGTNSGLHTDLKDNIFVQIGGIKTIYLVSPQETNFVYPQIDNIVNSDIQFPNPDLRRSPLLLRAKIYRHTLRSGDAVYIPKGWWHCLISNEDSISINHWFGPPISDTTYIKLIFKQGGRHIARAFFDFIKFGIFKLAPRNDFFFTPPPNGARLYRFLTMRGFSSENDPVSDN